MSTTSYEQPYPSESTAAEHPFDVLDFRRYPAAEMFDRARDFHAEMDRRRSVRMLSDEPVPLALIEDAIRTASAAPSGAHQQPWTFVVTGDQSIKREIRLAAEAEERINYLERRMNDEWQRALAPIGTDHHKEFLEIAPWLVAGAVRAALRGRRRRLASASLLRQRERRHRRRVVPRRTAPHGAGHADAHTDRGNAAEAGVDNVEFLDGHIEAVPLPDETVDVVISNCVINLAVDKTAVFDEMHRLLRPGGRVGVSDVVTEDQLTDAERTARGSYVGCIAGALSVAEYQAGLARAGFVDISVELTHAVGDGVHAAIVQAIKPDRDPAR